MKHIFVCFFVLLLSGLNAQDTLKIKTGFLFSAQGAINLQTPGKVFSTFTPVSMVVSFSKGNSLLNATYNMSSNKVGLLYWHKLSASTGYYGAFNKSVLVPGGYTGVGLTKSVADGRAMAFCEFGSTWHMWSPAIYVGGIIPLTFKVK